MLYFAYGSNMDWNQMRKRCASSRYLGVAVLCDHKLAFTRKSNKRGCGVADAVPEGGRTVWGVVYKIPDADDVDRLDRCEGFYPGGEKKNSYRRRECIVYVDGDENRPLMVQAYFAEGQPNPPPPPNQAYKDLILAGARYWQLPDDYIRELEQIEVSG